MEQQTDTHPLIPYGQENPQEVFSNNLQSQPQQSTILLTNNQGIFLCHYS